MGKQKKKEKCPTEINVVYNLKVVNVMWNSNLKLKQNKKGENGKVKSDLALERVLINSYGGKSETKLRWQSQEHVRKHVEKLEGLVIS